MAQEITNFVLKLAEDPKALSYFLERPEHALREAELSPQLQEVLLSKDPRAIREIISADLGMPGLDAAYDWVVVIVNVK